MDKLGDGQTSVVYLANEINTNEKVAVKVIKTTYLNGARAKESIKGEINIMKFLNHPGCIKLLEEGTKGQVVKASGRTLDDLTFLVMEHVGGETLFDFQEELNEGYGMGESNGRFIMHQLLDAVEYLHLNGVIHRDIKPENILIDENMNIKLIDFGFATNKNIEKLTSFYGTQSYMAPEIRKGKEYNGKEIDIFSLGVVLFSLVRGLFPFSESSKADYWYNLLRKGKL